MRSHKAKQVKLTEVCTRRSASTAPWIKSNQEDEEDLFRLNALTIYSPVPDVISLLIARNDPHAHAGFTSSLTSEFCFTSSLLSQSQCCERRVCRKITATKRCSGRGGYRGSELSRPS